MMPITADKARSFAVIGLLVVGAFLRFYQLDQYPLGVHQDELSNIYDGYSLSETGADRFGDMHPMIVRGFGENDYRPALYAWMAAVPQRFTGFSVAAGRLPSAILGTFSLFLIYGFARRMAGKDYAFFALLFGALSPLHAQLSRVAHEGGSLTGFFVILILYLWQRSAAKEFRPAELVLLGLATGLSANVYQATRLTAALFAFLIILDILHNSPRRLRALTYFSAAALLTALPQAVVLLRDPQRFAARARVLSIPTDNPVTYVAAFLHNYWLNLAPYYLFLPRPLHGLTVVRLNPVEIVFFYVGLFGLAFVVRSSRFRFYVYAAMAIVLLPAALTTGNPATMRTSGMAVLTPLFSAAGVILLGSLLRSERLRRKIYYPATVAAVVLFFAAMTYRYSRSEYFRELSFQKIAVDMARKAGEYQSGYDAIFVQHYVSEPYIYIAAFAPISPSEFQRMPKNLYSTGMDMFTRLGKYYFVWESTMPRTVDAYRNRPGRFLFISPTRLAGLTATDSVSFRDQKLYFQTY